MAPKRGEGEASSSRRKQVAKKAKVTPSHNVSPLYSTRELKYEYTFLLEELRDTHSVPVSLRYFEAARWLPLLSPPPVSYPRLVKMFYQNMTCEKDDHNVPRCITSRLDDFSFTITAGEVPHILGCLEQRPADCCLADTPDQPFELNEIITNMGGGLHGKSGCLRRAHMPSTMWFTDHVFSKNILPHGHQQERSGRILQALYAAYTETWIPVGTAMLITFWEVHDYIEHNLRAKEKVALPYPKFLTTIFKAKGYTIQSTEPRDDTSPHFGLAQWLKSSKSLQKRQQEMEDARDNRAARARRQPPPPPPANDAPFTMTRTQYDDLITGNRAVRRAVHDLGRRMVGMDSILHSLAHLHFPDSAAAMFAQADEAMAAYHPDDEEDDGDNAAEDNEGGDDGDDE